MIQKQVTVVKIYTLEGHDHLDKVLKILHDEEKVSGVTITRGIAGFSDAGPVRTSSLLTLSLELPLVVEFFDTEEKAMRVIERLENELNLKHIVSWSAVSHQSAA